MPYPANDCLTVYIPHTALTYRHDGEKVSDIMKYRIKRIYNHITRKYAVKIGNPAAVRDEPFRCAMCVINPADHLDPECHQYTNPGYAEYIADHINQHFPGAEAHVEEIRRYSYSFPLETLWRRGDMAFI